MPGPRRPIPPSGQRGMRRAEQLEALINEVAAARAARQRTRPARLPALEPIPAQTGVAAWTPTA